MRIRTLAVAVAILSCLGGGPAMAKKKPLDNRLYATYSRDGSGFDMDVCGAVGDVSGCFGGGTMSGPFEQPCALLEGSATTTRNVMTRDIYLLDRRTTRNAPAMLYVYTRKDTFGENSDSIELTLKQTLPLDFTGGKNAACFMAGNDTDVYAGTSASAVVDDIRKSDLTTSKFTGQDLLIGIDADERGDISVNFKIGFAIIAVNGFGEGGGGNEYLAGTRNSWKPQ